jgi:hypothetical protein
MNDTVPLSPGQRRLWFLDQLTADNIAYNSPASYRIRGPLDVSALERALAWVVDRHDVLRTRYELVAGEPVGVLGERGGFRLQVNAVASEEQAAEAIRADIEKPFDLERGGLFRARLHRVAADDHVLAIVVHHSVFDGTSYGIWAREVSTAYRAFLNGRTPPETTVTQYARHAERQRETFTEQVEQRQLRYWRETLSGAPEVLELPADLPRPPRPSHRAGFVDFTVSEEAAAALRDQAATAGGSLFMITLAAYVVLLARYTGSRDVVVGCPVDARRASAFEDTIGFFVNSLPVRVGTEGDPAFSGLVARTRWAVLDALSNVDVPFERIVEELAPARDLARNPLFQLWFDLAVHPADGDAGVPCLEGAEVSRFDAGSVRTRFDAELHLAVHPGGELTGRLQYATDLFSHPTAERFVAHYRNVLEDFAARPDARLSEVRMFTPAELHTLIEIWGTAS